MACQPTPISTIFSTSTSLIPSTITSSSAVLITPSASISTWVTTICTTPAVVASQTTDTNVPFPSPSSPSSSVPSSSSSDILASTSTDSVTSSSSDGVSVLSFGMTSFTSDTVSNPTLTSNEGDSPTSPVGELLEPSLSSVLDGQNLPAVENGGSMVQTNSHSQGIIRRRSMMAKHQNKRQDQIEQCQTITSTSSILATPTTSWSLIFTPADSTSLVVVPVETVMGGCESTSASSSSGSTVAPTSLTSTPTTSATPPTTSPSSIEAPLETASLSDTSISTSTSNLPVSSISSSAPLVPSSTSVEPTIPPESTDSPSTTSALSSSVSDLLSAVFTGPTLTSDSAQPTVTPSSSSSIDPLAPITSDALGPMQSTESIDATTAEAPIVPFGGSTSSSSDPDPSSSGATDTKAIIPGSKPSSTSSTSSKSLASQNTNPTLNHNSSVSPNGSNQEQDEGSGETNKGKAAGAAIGGLLALIALIASILFFIRWWKKRQRVERTRSLRASWFYGEKGIGGENEKRRSAPAPPIPHIQPMSRFSAPSFASRSEGLASLLTRPLKNLRRDSSPVLKPLKLVSGDPNDESRSSEGGILGKLATSFKSINLPSTNGITSKISSIPLLFRKSDDSKRHSFIVKSRNISSPQPIDPEKLPNETGGIFESSKLLPIFSKFRSFRQSFKRPFSSTSATFNSKDLNYIRQSQVIGDSNKPWAEKYKNRPPVPIPNIVGEAWEARTSESKDNNHPVKVNFMQPPPPSATGSTTKHGSMNSDGPYPTVVLGSLTQGQGYHGIGTALSPGMEDVNGGGIRDSELFKPTHVQLRHLTWGSSYAPPRTSVFSANGMVIHGGTGTGTGEPSEDGNSIYSRTSMSHGHGSNNLHRGNTMKSNISRESSDNLHLPPRSTISYTGSGSPSGNVPSPPLAPYLTGHGTFPKGLFSPLSAGSNGSRGSFAVLPSLPEYPNPTVNKDDKQIKDLRRITRSTAHSSGIWEYSAYVDTNSNNSQRGSENVQNQIQSQLTRITNNEGGQSTGNPGSGPMGILKPANASYSPIPPNSTMIYPNSNSNSPIPIHYPNAPSSMPTSNDIPYGGNHQPQPGYNNNNNMNIPSPRRTSNTPSGRGSLLKHSSLPASSYYHTDEENDQDYNSLPLPLPSRSPGIPQRSFTSPSPSTFGHGSNENERITKAWYEKPLWDGQQQHLGPQSILMPPRSAGSGVLVPDYTYSQKSGNSMYSKNGGGDRASRKSVKSVKSVRWEDEDIGGAL